MYKVCRQIDAFVTSVGRTTPSNTNVQLGGRDGCKYFHHGVTGYMRPKVRRINGGWWISIARHLRVFFSTTTLVSNETKLRNAQALDLLFEVHHRLRLHIIKANLQDFQDKVNALLVCLVQICAPFSKSACKSIKFHWPYHWALNRQELGCPADEKSLERMLGESQKKFFKHTNARFDIEAQLERKTMQMWVLRDLLHVAGEPPLLLSSHEIETEFCGIDENPRLLNLQRTTTLDTTSRSGLPHWLSPASMSAIFRGIMATTAGENPVLQWQPPIKVGTQIVLPIQDTQKLLFDPTRIKRMIFRALPKYQNAPAMDSVRVLIENGNGGSGWYFGQCVAFLRDANNVHYLLLRWYTRLDPPNCLRGYMPLHAFTLAPEHVSTSYSVLPVSCVCNGALMVPTPDNRFSLLLSPLESKNYNNMFV